MKQILFLLLILLVNWPLAAQVPPVTQCLAVAAAGGTANVITLPRLPCTATTTLVVVTLALTNTGTTTMQVIGEPALPVARADGTAIGIGELTAGATVMFIGNGQTWKAISTTATPLANINTGINNNFWGGLTASQFRLGGRLFVGGAVADSGVNSFPQLDWLSQLTQTGQGVAPFGTGDFATTYILANPTAVAGTPANIATPTQALMVGNSSLHGISTGLATYSTPRTIECAMVNNVTAAPTGGGPPVPVWCHYAVTIRQSTNAGASYVGEFEIANFSGLVTGWTPESATAGGSIGLELGCGAGLSVAGQFRCTVAEYIAANPMQFGAGLLFLASSLAADAPGGTIEAIGVPVNYEYQMYHAGLQGRLFVDTTDSVNLLSGSGILKITSQINSAAGNNAFLNAPTSKVAGLSINQTDFVDFNGSAFVPGTSSLYELGSTGLRWQTAYMNNLIVTTGVTTPGLPASAGAGGLYVCVDNVGVHYKKAVCP